MSAISDSHFGLSGKRIQETTSEEMKYLTIEGKRPRLGKPPSWRVDDDAITKGTAIKSHGPVRQLPEGEVAP